MLPPRIYNNPLFLIIFFSFIFLFLFGSDNFGFCLDDFYPIDLVFIFPARLFTSLIDSGFILFFIYINYIREAKIKSIKVF
jgi:hypothetical protein